MKGGTVHEIEEERKKSSPSNTVCKPGIRMCDLLQLERRLLNT